MSIQGAAFFGLPARLSSFRVVSGTTHAPIRDTLHHPSDANFILGRHDFLTMCPISRPRRL
jgi:hypothetical protein